MKSSRGKKIWRSRDVNLSLFQNGTLIRCPTSGVMYNYHPVPGQGRANQLYMRMSHNDATKCSKYWMALSGVVIITLLFYLPYVHSGPRKRKWLFDFNFQSTILIFCLFLAIVFVWPSNQTRNASILLSTSRSTTLLWPTGVCSNDPTSQRSLDEKPWV